MLLILSGARTLELDRMQLSGAPPTKLNWRRSPPSIRHHPRLDSDESGHCLLTFYRKRIDLGADDELLVTLDLRQLEHLHRKRCGL